LTAVDLRRRPPFLGFAMTTSSRSSVRRACRQNIAIGFTGEPVTRSSTSGATVSMNSHRP
jgi:hypothetical protein